MYPEADVEKTQGVEPREIREAREKRAMWEREHCDQMSAGCNRPLMTEAQIVDALFNYHPPTPTTLAKFAAINQAGKNFAEVILQNCPPGMDRTVAINYIRLARMLANAAVALDGLSL
jgi:hypothetical protein